MNIFKATAGLALAVLLPFLGQTQASPPDFLTATAEAGDDALSLLDRYKLAEHSCNVSKFLSLNNLPSHKLRSGETYRLPIAVVPYNGKTIRSTLGIDDWKTAKRIDEYNKRAKAEGLRPDYFVENKKLWVPWHELNCPQADKPQTEAPAKMAAAVGMVPDKKAEDEDGSSAATKRKSYPPVAKSLFGGEKDGNGDRIFPIFGPGYKKTPLLNKNMQGQVFYLISGHGGPDVGAQGKRAGNTLCEDEYAYDVTLRLHRLLLSHGATSYMIVRDNNDGIRDDIHLPCDKDEEVWGGQTIPLDQKERLQQRTDLINSLTDMHLKAGQKKQTIIEIHVDSRSQVKKQDVFFYYRPGSEPSLGLAQHIHKTFEEKYKKAQGGRGYSGTVTPRYLFTLKETFAQKAVYIELANIQNDWDQQRLVLKNNRQAIANWICHALLTE